MEGNACYKFSTINNYIRKTNAKPIRVAIDCGANIGNVTDLMLKYFKDVKIYAFEPVDMYYQVTRLRFKDNPNVITANNAITYRHLYDDDLGKTPRENHDLSIYFGRVDTCGTSAMGGSFIEKPDVKYDKNNYHLLDLPVSPVTLDDVVSDICQKEGVDEIDYIKFDCEGCENTALGACTDDTLSKIRFMSGEYHDLERFNVIMTERLHKTHRINIIGEKTLGAFFAERHDIEPGILKKPENSMYHMRKWLSDKVIGWEPFKYEYVTPGEKYFHALP